MEGTNYVNDLEQELLFMKQLLQFPGSMVGNMYIKKRNGENVWIDKQKVSYEDLLTLDIDSDVTKWLRDKKITYNDYDR
jgi:hypothetical protein